MSNMDTIATFSSGVGLGGMLMFLFVLWLGSRNDPRNW